MSSEPVYMPSGHWQQPAMILGQQWGYPDPQHATHHAHSNGVNHQPPQMYTTSMPFASQMTPTTTGAGQQTIYLRGLGMENMRPVQDRNGFQPGHPYSSPAFHQYHGGYAATPQVIHQAKQQPAMAYSYGIHPQFPGAPTMNGHHMDYSHPATPLTPMTQPLPSPHSTSFPPISPLLSRRGPPRKPKRSGHAVWVGNIPLGASIEALKDHFSRDATNEIESVFLMSKSNCAFVNYCSKQACENAVERFNHSLFGSVRLLCRLRRDTQSSSSRTREEHDVSVSPEKMSGNGEQSRSDSVLSPESEHESNSHSNSNSNSNLDVVVGIDGLGEKVSGLGISDETEASPPERITASSSSTEEDRYFILKSLTKEDLNESLQKGTWETQIHNQSILDSAYRQTKRHGKNVWLVFSVNKSGEYFGYAKMVGSPYDIVNEAVAEENVMSWYGQREDGQEKHVEGLRVVMTPATLTAPKGQIVDDQARGTLFWEAKRTRSEVSEAGLDRVAYDCDKSRPFKIEWQSVRRVTFQRTKGMKNAWNSGKDVKVARDGTELESGIGKRILELFFEDAVVNGATNGRK